jgi:hypothetical protein
MIINNNQEKQSDTHSDISILTDNKVFKGGLGLLAPKDKLSHIRKNQPQPASQTNIYNITNNISNSSNININSLKSNIINKNVVLEEGTAKANSSKNTTDNANEKGNSNATGYISFRSKDDPNDIYRNYAQNNTPIHEDAVEIADSTIITKKIVQKIGSLKASGNKSKKPSEHLNLIKGEELSINKIFSQKLNQPIEHEKELKNFELASSLDETDHNNLHIVHDEYIDDSDDSEENDTAEKVSNDSRDQNCFWNMMNDESELEGKKRSKSVCERALVTRSDKNVRHDEHTITSQSGSTKSKKEKYLSKIVCTLSRIERGRAIFVSNDDLIFVLPSLFVPKNLIVGHTYIFRISEFAKFQNKFVNVQNIHKKYSTLRKKGLNNSNKKIK